MSTRKAPAIIECLIIGYFVYEVLFDVASILFLGNDLAIGITVSEYIKSNGGVLAIHAVVLHTVLRLCALSGMLYQRKWGSYLMFGVVGLSMLEFYAAGMTHRIALDILYGYLAYWMICEEKEAREEEREPIYKKRKYVEAVIELPAQAA